jgi:hypothetical protein
MTLNLLGDNMDTRKTNTYNLSDNSQEAEVYVQKTRHKIMLSEQSASSNGHIIIGNKSFQNVVKL